MDDKLSLGEKVEMLKNSGAFDLNDIEAEVDHNHTVEFKKKRKSPAPYKHKERVLKSEYNYLERKYKILSWLTVAGWLGFVIALRYAL